MKEYEFSNNEEIVRYKDVEITRAAKIVLQDVTFSLRKGEFYYLTGRVGSGKSSLLKTMYGDVKIKKGTEAEVLGYDLLHLKKRDLPYLRRRIGIVFQDFQLLTDRSVHSNLKFVLKATGWNNKAEIEQRIDDVLSAVGMQNKSYKHPFELSGGEQQRIVIARALLNEPKLILADEPTGNLDPQTGFFTLALLHELSEKGHTVVMATHNMQLVKEFPGHILKCEDKKLVIES